MTRRMWNMLVVLLVISGIAFADELVKQTIKAEGVEFTIEDSVKWTVFPVGNTAILSSADNSMVISFLPSPIRGCDKVMERLGNNTPNEFGPGWYKTASAKTGNVTVCIDLKDRTLLASLGSEKNSKDPIYRSSAIVLEALGKALKK